MHPPQLQAVDDWIAKQPHPFPSRPEAVRRLVEMGLGRSKSAGRASAKTAKSVKQLAAKTIDRLADPTASIEEAASRKQRLLKGPEEFRNVRVDGQEKT
jgi:hypothetical protein